MKVSKYNSKFRAKAGILVENELYKFIAQVVPKADPYYRILIYLTPQIGEILCWSFMLCI
jgi:hypothetical protein